MKRGGGGNAPAPWVLAVPNVSEGRNRQRLTAWTATVEARGTFVLDLHSDAVHNRSVLTVAGRERSIPDAMASLAAGALCVDLREHSGVHPRLGGLDVCPIVDEGIGMDAAVEIARATGRTIASEAGIPVYLYAAAATRPETRELPLLRRGGLGALQGRAAAGLTPDFGPARIDVRRGVVCVGARGPLIAFNVWLRCTVTLARAVASQVRAGGGGLPATRALGLPMGEGLSQVSMNLTEPAVTGIDQAFAAVSDAARRAGAAVVGTEIVGLPPERYLPDPDGRAARLLLRPGRSLESALRRLS